MPFFIVLLCTLFIAPSVEEIPFSFKNNKILIEVREKVSGKTLRFFVDTGAPTILKRNETFPDPAIKQLSLQIGSHTLSGKDIETHDFSQNEAFVRAFSEVDGLLGHDLMRQLNWKIDWKAQKIYLSKKTFDIPKKDRLKNIGNGKPAVILHVEGSKMSPSLVIDTGSPLGINLEQAFFVFFREFAAGEIITKHRTLSTWDEVIDEELKIMKVSSFNLDRKPFATHEILFGTGESHLGTEFLQHYTLILNWSAKEIGLVD